MDDTQYTLHMPYPPAWECAELIGTDPEENENEIHNTEQEMD